MACMQLIQQKTQVLPTTKFDEPLETTQNVNFNFFEIVTAAGKFAKNPCSKIALDRFFQKLKTLEKDWYDFGVKFELVQRQKNLLLQECERERNKCKVYQNRLKLVKDNHENFERLRFYDLCANAYRGDEDTSHKSIQTDNSLTNLRPKSIRAVQDTLQVIKQMVEIREQSHDEKNRHIVELQQTISNLQELNSQLVQRLECKIEQDYMNSFEKINKRISNRKYLVNRSQVSINPPNLITDESTQISTADLIRSIRSIRSFTDEKSTRDGTDSWSHSRRLNNGDCKEIEVLRKIRKEIAKTQMNIKNKTVHFHTKTNVI